MQKSKRRPETNARDIGWHGRRLGHGTKFTAIVQVENIKALMQLLVDSLLFQEYKDRISHDEAIKETVSSSIDVKMCVRKTSLDGVERHR